MILHNFLILPDEGGVELHYNYHSFTEQYARIGRRGHAALNTVCTPTLCVKSVSTSFHNIPSAVSPSRSSHITQQFHPHTPPLPPLAGWRQLNKLRSSLTHRPYTRFQDTHPLFSFFYYSCVGCFKTRSRCSISAAAQEGYRIRAVHANNVKLWLWCVTSI